MNIIQVVGYKNSGKTTLVQQLVRSFTASGLRVASLKHHGHGGVLKSVTNTDSDKHKKAGTIAAGVEGGGEFQLSIKKENWGMEELLAFYRIIDVDLVIVEGFKKQDYNKIVLIRGEEDFHLLQQLTNIVAVVSAVPIHLNIPIFKPSEHQKLYDSLSSTLG